MVAVRQNSCHSTPPSSGCLKFERFASRALEARAAGERTPPPSPTVRPPRSHGAGAGLQPSVGEDAPCLARPFQPGHCVSGGEISDGTAQTQAAPRCSVAPSSWAGNFAGLSVAPGIALSFTLCRLWEIVEVVRGTRDAPSGVEEGPQLRPGFISPAMWIRAWPSIAWPSLAERVAQLSRAPGYERLVLHTQNSLLQHIARAHAEASFCICDKEYYLLGWARGREPRQWTAHSPSMSSH